MNKLITEQSVFLNASISRSVLSIATACMVFFVSVPEGSAQTVYSLDDGSAELATGPFNGQTAAFMNRFQVTNDQDIINSIQIEWNFGLSDQVVTAGVWSDPDNNSQPNDAVLIASSLATMSAKDSGFQTFDLQLPVDVGENGDYFFVGVFYQHSTASELLIGVDRSGSNQSFAFDLATPTQYSQLPNLMIRATATPEPSTTLLTGMSALLLALRRRR